MEGEEPRPHRVNQLLDYLFEYFIQDYVETWYDLLSPDDPEIGKFSKETFWVRPLPSSFFSSDPSRPSHTGMVVRVL